MVDLTDGNQVDEKETSTAVLTQDYEAQTDEDLEEVSEISVALPAGDWESSGPTRPELTEGERDSWSSDIDFLMTCISMSVGLGNVYRFPFIAYTNGGGAFLIPYLIVLMFVGRPMYYFELLLGQFSSLGCIQAWEIVPVFKGIGYVMAVACACTVTFYTSILATAVFYFVMSFWPQLPWSTCDPKRYLLDGKMRKDVHCDTTYVTNGTFSISFQVENGLVSNCNGSGQCHPMDFHDIVNISGGNGSVSELYFKYSVVQAYDNIDNGIGPPDWRMGLALFTAWLMIFLIQVKGATGSAKVAWFTAMFPYVILFTLFGMACNLEGAMDGILYFFTPQWDKLLEVSVWFQAVQQCFFSLGMGLGPVIVFGSFNDFRHNLPRDVWIVSAMDTLTSILAGATIFAILGHLAMGRDISKVVSSGPNIAFVSYPAVLSSFGPYPVPQIFSALFFFMLMTLGIGSAVSYCTTVSSVVSDEFPKLPKLAVTGAICVGGFFIGLIYVTPGGPFMLLLVDTYGTSVVLYVVVLMEVIAVSWCYGLRNFCNDMEFMLRKNISWYWKICWGFVVPVGLLVVLVYTFLSYQDPKVSGVPYPKHDLIIGKTMSGIILSVIPIVGVQVVVTRKTRSWYKKIRASFYPSIAYCPKDPAIREEWMEYKQTVPFRYHPWKIFTRWRRKYKREKEKRLTVDSRALLQLINIAAKAERNSAVANALQRTKQKQEKIHGAEKVHEGEKIPEGGKIHEGEKIPEGGKIHEGEKIHEAEKLDEKVKHPANQAGDGEEVKKITEVKNKETDPAASEDQKKQTAKKSKVKEI